MSEFWIKTTGIGRIHNIYTTSALLSEQLEQILEIQNISDTFLEWKSLEAGAEPRGYKGVRMTPLETLYILPYLRKDQFPIPVKQWDCEGSLRVH